MKSAIVKFHILCNKESKNTHNDKTFRSRLSDQNSDQCEMKYTGLFNICVKSDWTSGSKLKISVISSDMNSPPTAQMERSQNPRLRCLMGLSMIRLKIDCHIGCRYTKTWPMTYLSLLWVETRNSFRANVGNRGDLMDIRLNLVCYLIIVIRSVLKFVRQL